MLVMGLGLSGRAAAMLARDRGQDVIGVDLRTDIEPIEGVRMELGPHRRASFLGAKQIVVSPGVPATQPDLRAAHAAGVEILGELGFAARQLEGLPMCAVTGTNGKSTVTWFVGQLLEAAGFRPFVGGNLGNPLSNAVREGGRERYDIAVVEVSSYQLEWPSGLHPRVGVILNLTPDHLGRHGDMDGYAAAKARLFDAMGPTDLAILPAGARRLIRHAGSKGLRAWTGALPGVARLGDRAQVSVPALEIDASLDLSGLAIPGAHNRDNAAVAALIAMAMGAAPDAVAEAMSTLKPLAHRMEVVGTHRGVVWINDSKATNLEAARVGLSGLDSTAVVLLGGQAKGPGFGALSELLRRHRAVVCFGASGPAIADELEAAGLSPHRAEGLVDALTVAAGQAHPGDAVLLSPGTASFDEFDNFEHRGRVFSEWVHAQMEDR